MRREYLPADWMEFPIAQAFGDACDTCLLDFDELPAMGRRVMYRDIETASEACSVTCARRVANEIAEERAARGGK